MLKLQVLMKKMAENVFKSSDEQFSFSQINDFGVWMLEIQKFLFVSDFKLSTKKFFSTHQTKLTIFMTYGIILVFGDWFSTSFS